MTTRAESTSTREFPYSPSPWLSLFLFVAAAFGETIFIWMATSGGRPEYRTLFVVLACLGPIGLVALGAQFIGSIFLNRRVVVASGALTLPKPTRHGFSRQEITIPIESILSYRLVDQFAFSTLYVRHESGTLAFVSLNFPTKGVFNAFVAALAQELQRSTQTTAK
jgi:hypothetical protein